MKLYRVILVLALQPRERNHTARVFCAIGEDEDAAIAKALAAHRTGDKAILADAREVEDGAFMARLHNYSKSEVNAMRRARWKILDAPLVTV